MLEISTRVISVPNICGIELAFAGRMEPSTIEGYQVFNNSIPRDTDFTNLYAGRASVAFSEESDKVSAGILWKQKLTLRFPATDKFRSERLETMHRVKFIKIKLDSGKHIVLGRNDFQQNAPPLVEVKATEKLAQVEFSTRSVFASGYVPASPGSLPAIFPIDFLED